MTYKILPDEHKPNPDNRDKKQTKPELGNKPETGNEDKKQTKPKHDNEDKKQTRPKHDNEDKKQTRPELGNKPETGNEDKKQTKPEHGNKQKHGTAFANKKVLKDDVLNNRLMDKTNNRLMDKTNNRLMDETNNRLMDKTNNRLMDKTNNRLMDETNNRLMDKTNNRLMDKTNNRLMDKTNNMLMDETDKRIIEYFFTNIDKPVFYAKNLHPEVWALFQARYSRSTQGLRQGFLKLLKEADQEYNNLRHIFEKEQAPGIELEHALNKAVKFMDKWVLGYGHSSIAEGAVANIGIEGVSILVTKYIETARLCSFIEKSTRYIKFDRESFYKPTKIENSSFSKDYDNVIGSLFNTYEELQEPVFEYVKSVTEKEKAKNENAWLRACGARRFDAVRYLLPAATKTSFGWTVNTRELTHTIQKMRSYQLEEAKQIADLLAEEGTKVMPSLFKHAEQNKYLKNRETVLNRYLKQTTNSLPGHNNVTLVRSPSKQELIQLLNASLIYKNSILGFEEAVEKANALDNKLELFNSCLNNMGAHDIPPREFENINFVWDVLIDYGAFRDIQRHRIMSQSEQLLTTFLGYEIPDDIKNSGCSQQYENAMKQADKVFREMFDQMPYEAQYIVPLGYRKRVLLGTNLRELHYLIRLRSTPQGHISYRNIVQKMYLILKDKYGDWAGSIECNFDKVDLGRLKSELKIEGLR